MTSLGSPICMFHICKILIKTSQNIEFYFWTIFSSDKIFVTSEKLSDIFLSDKVDHRTEMSKQMVKNLGYKVTKYAYNFQWTSLIINYSVISKNYLTKQVLFTLNHDVFNHVSVSYFNLDPRWFWYNFTKWFYNMLLLHNLFNNC